MDSLPEAILCLENGEKVLYLNQAAETLFSVHRAQIIGKPIEFSEVIARLFPDASPDPANPPAPFHKQFEFKTRGGKVLPLEVAITESASQKNRIQTAVIRDLSTFQRMEEALVNSRKSQAIAALTGGISHDFNNILTALLSQLDLALDTPHLPEEAGRHIEQAQTSGRRAAELISRLQTFSRQSEAKTTMVDLAELIEQAVLILRRTIDRRIQIRHDPLKGGQWIVKGDAGQLIQVILNLCLNARDAMPNGGTLSLLVKRVDRRNANGGSTRYLQTSVCDTGEGISDDVKKRLFEPYFTTRTIGRGTGLGLSIAQNIVQDMNGLIEVESERSRGSRFHVLLPEAGSITSLPDSSLHQFVSSETRALEGKESILIADDEEMVRLVMRAVLSYRGYKISEARDGQHLLEVLQEGGSGFDLVLLDLDMPRLNGWDALKRIREEHPGLRVILLSGGSVDSDETTAKERGACGFLGKPFKNEALVQLVRRTLDSEMPAATTDQATMPAP